MTLDLRRLRASLILMVTVGAVTSMLLPVPIAAASEGSAPIDGASLLNPPARICGNKAHLDGPSSPPDGAVVIQPGTNVSDVTNNHGAGTVFWLSPGTHTTGPDQYDNITPKQGNKYIGAPGAVLDGKGVNAYAFTGQETGVRIAYLTIKNFVAPNQEGVVNHDQANGWIIEHNTIADNSGAALMGGARQVLAYNCIARNGQYGLNYFQTGDGIEDVIVHHNEIVRNNTDRVDPDCGCSGGAKFWAVNGAEITDNWVHDNYGVGLWADTDNRDFRIEGNLIQNNDDVGLFYEISYNALIRNNAFRENAHEVGAAATGSQPAPSTYRRPAATAVSPGRPPSRSWATGSRTTTTESRCGRTPTGSATPPTTRAATTARSSPTSTSARKGRFRNRPTTTTAGGRHRTSTSTATCSRSTALR